jgi:Replication-relaxation
MAKSRTGWYEREEVEKVTLDWVKTNCKLTEREMEILQLVYDRKLVRRDHLEIISESYRNCGDNRTRLLNRAIKKLYQSMCLDKVHEAQELGKGNTPCIVGLDRGGSMLLNVPHRKRIAHRKSLVKGRKYITRTLPANYRHINGVNQLEVETIQFCSETDTQLIGWHHEKPQEFVYGQERVAVIPDVSMELKVREKPLYAFIEYDTGSENRGYKDRFPIIKEKVIKYRKYKASKLWEDDYPYFPILLLVTEDDKRIPYFNQKCKENKIKGFGVYSENYVEFMKHLANMV